MTQAFEEAGTGSAADHARQLANRSIKKRAAAMAAAFDLMALHDRARADWLRGRACEWRRRIDHPEIEN